MSQYQLKELTVNEVPRHADLSSEDQCFYWRKYNVRFKDKERNKIIWDFKITPSQINSRPNLKQDKEYAIRTLANEMINIFIERGTLDVLSTMTFVPIPSSKLPAHSEYDDRLFRLLTLVGERVKNGIDIRNLISQRESTLAFHERKGSRLNVNDLMNLYTINSEYLDKIQKTIVIFDDLLTKGTHFKAAQNVIKGKIGNNSNIIGLFIARSENINE